MADRTVAKRKPKRPSRYRVHKVSLIDTIRNLYVCRKDFDDILVRLGHEPEWFRESRGTRSYTGEDINLFRYVGRKNKILVLGVSNFNVGGVSKIDPRRRRTLDFLTYSLRDYDLRKLEKDLSFTPAEFVLFDELKEKYEIIWI